MRDMGPDAQINYSLHSSILSCQLPFIESVRCPLRMAWEEKCHSCQRVKKGKCVGETHKERSDSVKSCHLQLITGCICA